MTSHSAKKALQEWGVGARGQVPDTTALDWCGQDSLPDTCFCLVLEGQVWVCVGRRERATWFRDLRGRGKERRSTKEPEEKRANTQPAAFL